MSGGFGNFSPIIFETMLFERRFTFYENAKYCILQNKVSPKKKVRHKRLIINPQPTPFQRSLHLVIWPSLNQKTINLHLFSGPSIDFLVVLITSGSCRSLFRFILFASLFATKFVFIQKLFWTQLKIDKKERKKLREDSLILFLPHFIWKNSKRNSIFSTFAAPQGLSNERFYHAVWKIHKFGQIFN
jgi:hypothetical protein